MFRAGFELLGADTFIIRGKRVSKKHTSSSCHGVIQLHVTFQVVFPGCGAVARPCVGVFPFYFCGVMDRQAKNCTGYSGSQMVRGGDVCFALSRHWNMKCYLFLQPCRLPGGPAEYPGPHVPSRPRQYQRAHWRG